MIPADSSRERRASDSVSLVVVRKPDQPDDLSFLVGLEQQDERSEVHPPHPLQPGAEGFEVKGDRDDLGDLPVHGSTETGVLDTQPAVVVLELRRP